MYVLVLALALSGGVTAGLTGLAPPGRTRTSFDHGWLYARDIPGPTATNCTAFPTRLDKVQCLGFQHVPAASNVSGCRSAACLQGTLMWQLDGGDTGNCWVGNSCSQNITGPQVRRV